MNKNVEKIEWKDEYNIGVAEIDEQHKKLVAIINKLHDLLTFHSFSESAKVSGIMDELLEYTKYHFEFEEKSYIRKYNYANAELHIMQHNNFVDEVQSKIDKEKNYCTEESLKTFYRFLIVWLLNHIARADKAWSIAIKSKTE